MSPPLDSTKLTLTLPPVSQHFPATSDTVKKWNSINNAIRIIIGNITSDMSDSDVLGLLYRFSGTLTSYARKLETFKALPTEWESIRKSYDEYISHYVASTTKDDVVSPEQFVFELCKKTVHEAMAQKEQCSMQSVPIGSDVARMFADSLDLFRLLSEWCKKEEESNMVANCL